MGKKTLSSSERRGLLLEWFNMTGGAKTKAVQDYLKDLLERDKKFICFAHHQVLNVFRWETKCRLVSVTDRKKFREPPKRLSASREARFFYFVFSMNIIHACPQSYIFFSIVYFPSFKRSSLISTYFSGFLDYAEQCHGGAGQEQDPLHPDRRRHLLRQQEQVLQPVPERRKDKGQEENPKTKLEKKKPNILVIACLGRSSLDHGGQRRPDPDRRPLGGVCRALLEPRDSDPGRRPGPQDRADRQRDRAVSGRQR